MTQVSMEMHSVESGNCVYSVSYFFDRKEWLHWDVTIAKIFNFCQLQVGGKKTHVKCLLQLNNIFMEFKVFTFALRSVHHNGPWP